MKKRFLVLIMALPIVATSYAETTEISGISDAADGVATYLPYVRSLCYIIASIIAIVGTTITYLSMQTNPHNVTKRITLSVGSCMTFVFMATALPQFFGVDDSMGSNGGSNPSNGIIIGGNGGFLASDKGGISQGGINTIIPPLSDRNWIRFPEGTTQVNANLVLDLWERSGNGTEGSYSRTLSSIENLFLTRQIDHMTYQNLIIIAGNLPHS